MMRNESNKTAANPGSPRVIVLGVELSSSRSGEHAERRRRARYAVATALITRGFVPEQSETIHAVGIPAKGDPDRTVAAEVFERDGLRGTGGHLPLTPDKVLVVWHSPIPTDRERVSITDAAPVLASVIDRAIKGPTRERLARAFGGDTSQAHSALLGRIEFVALGPDDSSQFPSIARTIGRTLAPKPVPPKVVPPSENKADTGVFRLTLMAAHELADLALLEADRYLDELPPWGPARGRTTRGNETDPSQTSRQESAMRARVASDLAWRIESSRKSSRLSQTFEAEYKGIRDALKELGDQFRVRDSDTGWPSSVAFNVVLETLASRDEYSSLLELYSRETSPAMSARGFDGTEAHDAAIRKFQQQHDRLSSGSRAAATSPLLRTPRPALGTRSGDVGIDALTALLEPHVTYVIDRATVADALIFDTQKTNDSRTLLPVNPWQAAAGRSCKRIVRATATDVDLAEALIDELERRGHDVGSTSGRDHLVLLADLDTYYGRSLRTTFEGVVRHRRAQETIGLEDAIHGAKEDTQKPLNRVHRYSFLSGLTGTLDDSERVRERLGELVTKGNSDAGGLDIPLMRPDGEVAFGTTRFDYARRIARSIARRSEELNRSGRGRITCIGLLASDVRDKQVLLQALNEELHDVLFFTTDLDARLLQSDEYESTRNLIIASPFGLELHPLLQHSAPPFRDTYQTATYLATLAAVGPLPHPVFPPSFPTGAQAQLLGNTSITPQGGGASQTASWITLEQLSDELGARLFEVARSSAIDITPRADAHALQGAPHSTFGIMRPLLLAVFALIIAGSIVLTSPAFHRREVLVGIHRRDSPVLTTVAVTLISTLGLVAAIAIDDWRGDGEPLGLFNGVSVWPSELIRLLACGLGIALALHLHSREEITFRTVAKRFSLPAPVEGTRPQPYWHYLSLAKRLNRTPTKAHGSSARNRITRVARHVLAQGRLLKRWYRFHRIRRRAPRTEAGLRRVRNRWGVLSDDAGGYTVNAAVTWNRFLRLSHPSSRFIRILPSVVAMLLLSWGLEALMAPTLTPVRGPIASTVDQLLLITIRVTIVVLVFWCIDIHHLTTQFVRTLRKARLEWPGAESVEGRKVPTRNEREARANFEALKLASLLSESASWFALPACVAIGGAVLARAHAFDDWSWSEGLVIAYGGLAFFAIASALVLRRAALRARMHSLEIIEEYARSANLDALRGQDSRVKRRVALEAEQLREQAETISLGAYRPIRESAFARSLLIPLGGAGLVALLDYATTIGL